MLPRRFAARYAPGLNKGFAVGLGYIRHSSFSIACIVYSNDIVDVAECIVFLQLTHV